MEKTSEAIKSKCCPESAQCIPEVFPQELSLSPSLCMTGVLPHSSTAHWAEPLLRLFMMSNPDKTIVDLRRGRARLGSQCQEGLSKAHPSFFPTHPAPFFPDHSLASPCQSRILFPIYPNLPCLNPGGSKLLFLPRLDTLCMLIPAQLRGRAHSGRHVAIKEGRLKHPAWLSTAGDCLEHRQLLSDTYSGALLCKHLQ